VYGRLVPSDASYPVPLAEVPGAPIEIAGEAARFEIDIPRTATRLACREVRGFADALAAARDPRAPAPARLVLVAPACGTRAWLDGWSEDAEQVRRSLVIRRALDDVEIAVVATLASHGYGVPTSLAVESVRADGQTAISRSGVHLKVDVEAALAADPLV
jgi:hypothetical protein